MLTRIKVAGLVVGILLMLSQPVVAQDSRFAISGKAGTLGLGLEGTGQINPQVNGRLGVNAFQYEFDGEESEIEYDFDVELLNFAALLDWFPFGGSGFRLTGGVIVNENSLDAEAKSSSTFTIGDTTFNAAQVGTLTGNVDFNPAGPYLGIGWGNPFGKNKRWSFALDLGVFYQGEPDVNLNTTGLLSSNAAFQADLAREEQNLEDELAIFKFYPVLAVGITYRF